MQNVQCILCKHFRMWDGDPCCLEPDSGWKVVLPDMKRECDSYELPDRILVDWGKVWEQDKFSFFGNYSLKGDLYDKYISEHPEYKDKIQRI